MFNSLAKYRRWYFVYWFMLSLLFPFEIAMGVVAIVSNAWLNIGNLYVSEAGVLSAVSGASTNFGLMSFTSTSNIAFFGSISGNYNGGGTTDQVFGTFGSAEWRTDIFLWCFIATFFVYWLIFQGFYMRKNERTYSTKEKFIGGFVMPIVPFAFGLSGMSYFTATGKSNLPTSTLYGPTYYAWCYEIGWAVFVGIPFLIAALFWSLPHEGSWNNMKTKKGHRVNKRGSNANTTAVTDTDVEDRKRHSSSHRKHDDVGTVGKL